MILLGRKINLLSSGIVTTFFHLLQPNHFERKREHVSLTLVSLQVGQSSLLPNYFSENILAMIGGRLMVLLLVLLVMTSTSCLVVFVSYFSALPITKKNLVTRQHQNIHTLLECVIQADAALGVHDGVGHLGSVLSLLAGSLLWTLSSLAGNLLLHTLLQVDLLYSLESTMILLVSQEIQLTWSFSAD